MTRALTALVVVVAVGSLVGCARQTALHVEGAAPSPVGRTTAPAVPAPLSGQPAPDSVHDIDLRSTVLADTAVSQHVKDFLTRCDDCGLQSPSYVDLTGDGRDDVIAQVASGAEDTGGEMAYYVYSLQGGAVRQIFGVTGTSAMEVWPDNGDLMLWRAIYSPGDRYCCPSGEETVRYAWDGRRLAEAKRYPERRPPTRSRLPTVTPMPKETR
ncbi:hypothetical protein [Streptoalloteichus hindustanus]|uniref:Lipoprotein n=1 Tax=Streptoalloteichus hindustanus TaxID=2017 RepID=A0A1M5GDJ1_STRHI|nr:hypothetical protein [Streptoalloteichus hindustanus]SHG01561.1 hypothetical protein SAMN05444320_10666 [Streptoalloteichus hindustanus]